jgi:hypothetical protein
LGILRNWAAGVTDPGQPTVFSSHSGQQLRRQIGLAGPIEGEWAVGRPVGAIGGDGYGRQFGYFDDGMIHEFDPAVDDDRFLASMPPPALDIEGMAFDGQYLYVSTRAGDLFTLQPDDGQVLGRSVTPHPWFGLAAERLVGDQLLPDVDDFWVDLTGKSGKAVDIALTGIGTSLAAERLELLDADGRTVLATGSAAPGDAERAVFDLAIRDWIVPSDGRYVVRVTSRTESDYGLLVAESLLLDNGTSQGVPRPLDSRGRVLGRTAERGDAPDRYTVELTGETVISVTVTAPPRSVPLAEAAPITVRAYDPHGQPAGIAAGSLDGVTHLRVRAPVTGQFTLELSTSQGPADYLLQARGERLLTRVLRARLRARAAAEAAEQASRPHPAAAAFRDERWLDDLLVSAVGVSDAEQPGTGPAPRS